MKARRGDRESSAGATASTRVDGPRVDGPPGDWLWRPSRRIAVLTGSLLALAPLLVALRSFTPHYQTNDDFGIDSALQGVIVHSRPTGSLPHPLFQWVVQALYAAFPDAPCYRLVCTAIHVGATALALSRVLSRGVDWLACAGVALFLVTFELYAHVAPQFTVTACHAAGVGVATWLSTSVDDTVSANEKRVWGIFAAFAILGGMTLRVDAAHLAAVVFAPIVFVECVVRGSLASPSWFSVRWRSLIGPAAPLVFLALTLVGFWATASLRNADPAAAKLARFHRARVAVIDLGRLPSGERLPEVLKDIGWSMNDVELLLAWCFADEQVFSAENLEKLAADAPARHDVDERLASLPALTRVPQFRVWLLFVPLAMVAGAARRRDWIAVLATAAVVAGVVAFLYVRVRLPERVLLPILSSTAAWLLFRPTDEPAPRGSIRQALGIAWLLAAIVGGGWMIGLTATFDANIAPFYRQAAPWINQALSNPDHRVIIVGSAFPFEGIPAWTPLSRLKNSRALWLASDGAHSDAVKDQMRSMGIENVFRAIATDQSVVVIAHEGIAPLLIRFAKERLGIACKLRQTPIALFPFQPARTVTLELIKEP